MKQIKDERMKLFQGAPNNLDLRTVLIFLSFFFSYFVWKGAHASLSASS